MVLLERRQFASGTSWHAAGLIGTARASDTHAELCTCTRRLLAGVTIPLHACEHYYVQAERLHRNT